MRETPRPRVRCAALSFAVAVLGCSGGEPGTASAPDTGAGSVDVGAPVSDSSLDRPAVDAPPPGPATDTQPATVDRPAPPLDAPARADGGAPVGAAVVGPQGGMLQADNGSALLEVPSEALDQPVMLTIRRAAGAPPGNVGAAYEIGPDGTTFKKPAVLSLAFDAASIGAGDPEEVVIATVVNGRWTPAAVTMIDQSASRARAFLSHLSIWGLMLRPRVPCGGDPECVRMCCKGTPAGGLCTGDKFMTFTECYGRCTSDPGRAFGSRCMRTCCRDGAFLRWDGACVLTTDEAAKRVPACMVACLDALDEIFICPQTGRYCNPCGADPQRCLISGAGCTLRGGDFGPSGVPGRCQLRYNGCGTCVERCETRETCGNDIDDDCNGRIDDGCAARRCSTAATCSPGSRCEDGYCTPCEADPHRCLISGAACTLRGGDFGSSGVPGRCQLRHNGCGTCVERCEARETCGNDIDDDCNGAIDDGCVARRCITAATCSSGNRCENGYCTPCEADPHRCLISGAGCTLRGGDFGSTGVPGRCQLRHNGCGTCVERCEARETCGNDIDDDCDGVIDDGCAARRCTISATCSPGSRCDGGHCTPCESDPHRCSVSGAACTLRGGDFGSTGVPGRCQLRYNGCGTCVERCEVRETCGNDVDDDCNGAIDDGCTARACATSATCRPGERCD